MNPITETNLPSPTRGRDEHDAAAAGIVRPAPLASRRHARWRRRMITAGRCADCGDVRNLYTIHCDDCQDKRNRWRQRNRGGDAWQPGGPGRPPKWACLAKVTRQRDEGRATLKRLLRAGPEPAFTSLKATVDASSSATTQLASNQPKQERKAA